MYQDNDILYQSLQFLSKLKLYFCLLNSILFEAIFTSFEVNTFRSYLFIFRRKHFSEFFFVPASICVFVNTFLFEFLRCHRVCRFVREPFVVKIFRGKYNVKTKARNLNLNNLWFVYFAHSWRHWWSETLSFTLIQSVSRI